MISTYEWIYLCVVKQALLGLRREKIHSEEIDTDRMHGVLCNALDGALVTDSLHSTMHEEGEAIGNYDV